MSDMSELAARDFSTRTLRLQPTYPEKEAEDSNVRQITFLAATDVPLVRETMHGFINETLDFDGLDDARLNSKTTPLLDTHRMTSSQDVLGRIVNHEIRMEGGQRALYATAEFYMDRPRSKNAYEDIRSGLTNNISVSYSPVGPGGRVVERLDRSSSFDPSKDPVANVTYRKFSLDEASIVPVGADPAARVSRALASELGDLFENDTTKNTNDTLDPESDSTDNQRSADTMTNETPKEEIAAKAEAPAVEKESSPARQFDGSGVRYLTAQRSKLRERGVDEEFENKLLDEASQGEGLSEKAVAQRLWDHIVEQDAKNVPATRSQAPAVHVKEADHNTFSVARTLDCLAKGGGVDGLEGEMLQDYENERTAADPSFSNGIRIPFGLLAADPVARKYLLSYHDADARAEYIEGSRDFSVGNTPTKAWTEVFDEGFFRPALQSKATVLPYVNMMSGELYQNKIGLKTTGQMSTAHYGETNTRAESTGFDFDNFKLEYNEITARFDLTRRALHQSAVAFPILLAEAQTQIGVGIDKALNAESTSNGPTGVPGFTGLVSGDVGTNGGVPSYGHLTKMRSILETNYANVGSDTYWVVTPGVKAKIATQGRLAGSTGGGADRILNYDVNGSPNIDGMPVITSNHLKTNTTKGTLQNAHTIYAGNLGEIDMGIFNALEVDVDRTTARETSQVRVYVSLAYDFVCAHPRNFVVAKDIDAS